MVSPELPLLPQLPGSFSCPRGLGAQKMVEQAWVCQDAVGKGKSAEGQGGNFQASQGFFRKSGKITGATALPCGQCT